MEKIWGKRQAVGKTSCLACVLLEARLLLLKQFAKEVTPGCAEPNIHEIQHSKMALSSCDPLQSWMLAGEPV